MIISFLLYINILCDKVIYHMCTQTLPILYKFMCSISPISKLFSS